ncbi:choice-of-anchor D domain-containing protein, partial [bacterium]|nr:choice-of-anchor D domain-containing protein [bacterium]
EGSFDFAPAADGAYGFYTVATDGAGNVEAAPVAADNTTGFDTVAPESTCESPDLANSSKIAVSFTSSDDRSFVAEVCLYSRFGEGAWVLYECTSATIGSFDFEPYGDGTYEFYTIATDGAGNLEEAPIAADDSTEYDTVAPQSSCTSPTYANSSPIAVDFTANDSPSTGIASVDLWYSIDGGDWTDSGLSETGTEGSFDFVPAADGAYEFYTIATDGAGNVEAAPGTADGSTEYDTVAPQSSCTSPSSTNSKPIAVGFTASDGTSGIAEVILRYRLNGGDWTSSGLSSTEASGAFSFAPGNQGMYEFYTIATDNAGNVEAIPGAADDTTEYDTTAPHSSCESPEFASSSPIAVSFTASDTPSSGIAAVDLWYRVNGGIWTNSGLSEAGTEGSFAFEPEADGTYMFCTIATDGAGNVEAVPEAADDTTEYDTVAPQSFCESPEFANSSPIAVGFTAGDSPSSGIAAVDLWYRLNGGDWTDSGLAGTGTFGSFNFVPGADGTYEFYTIATDGAGNVEAVPEAADDTTEYDTVAPQSFCTAPADATTTPIVVDFTASDTDSGVLETKLRYRKDSGAWQNWGAALPGTSGSFDFTAPDGEGLYDFYTVCADNAGNIEAAPAGPGATTNYHILAPEIWLSADSIDFGEVPTGDHAEETLVVRNDGDRDLTIESVLTGLSIFTISYTGALPAVLAPSGTFEIDVTFTPDSVGEVNDELTITSDDPDSPSSAVDLAGEGVLEGELTVDISTNAAAYQFDDTLEMNIAVQNTGEPVTVDVYLILIYDLGGPEERQWSGSLATWWIDGILPVATDFPIGAGYDLAMQWWSSTLPSEMPGIAKSGTYTLWFGAVEPGTLNLVSNFASCEFTLDGEPFADIYTNAEFYSLTADKIDISLDLQFPPYSLDTDFYMLMMAPDGTFWIPTLDAWWQPGVLPLMPNFEAPPGLVLEDVFWEVDLPAMAPFDAAGQFWLFTALAEPGTVTPYSDIGVATFTLQ